MNSHNAFEKVKDGIRKQVEHYVHHNVPAYTKERLTEAILGVFVSSINDVNKVMEGDISDEDIQNYMYTPTLPERQSEKNTQLELPFVDTEPIYKNENDLW